MASRFNRSSSGGKSRKNRGAVRFSMEGLERRELMAADLGAVSNLQPQTNLQAVQVAPASLATGPVVQPLPGTAPGSTTVGGVGGTKTPGQDLAPLPNVLRAQFSGGVLSVNGSDAADNLFITEVNGMIEVREVVKELTLLSVPKAQVLSISVRGNGGNDWVKVDEALTIRATLYGDSGNDELYGASGADYLYGGTGNDKLVGYGGADVMNGDAGDDLMVGGDGNDIMKGGAGSDYMLGGAGNDVMDGQEGDDQLFGEEGNDTLVGGAGKNLMDGGAGADNLFGGDDVDAMYGGEGNDWLRGFGGEDRMRGEGGADTLDGGDGDDAMDGGLGNDFMDGKAGNDAMSGGLGNDTLQGGEGQDWLDGDEGADTLYGSNGNDWLQGGAGTDTVNGGAGSNNVYQNYAPGYIEYGTSEQALGLGFVTDFAADVWDTLSGVFSWALDKAESIGRRFVDWVSNLDNRLLRLTQDLAGALTNWPWEADFWKGLGRTVLDALEVVGLTEAWETAFEILKPWQRGMTSQEIAVARTVFGNSIDYNMVRFDEHSLMAAIGRTHVTGHIINSTSNIDDQTMIHELTHVWQYENRGLIYIPEALDAQGQDDGGYEFGGLDGLRAAKAAGHTFAHFNPEQQGHIVETYFAKRQIAKVEYEAKGLIAPAALRDELDVYIYFVKEVSTLTAAQLDTPDPVVFKPPIATTGGVLSPVSKPTTPKPPTTAPLVAAVPAVTDLNGDGRIDALDEALRTRSAGKTTAPVTLKSLDAAFATV